MRKNYNPGFKMDYFFFTFILFCTYSKLMNLQKLKNSISILKRLPLTPLLKLITQLFYNPTRSSTFPLQRTHQIKIFQRITIPWFTKFLWMTQRESFLLHLNTISYRSVFNACEKGGHWPWLFHTRHAANSLSRLTCIGAY